jgi:hypothetical protein
MDAPGMMPLGRIAIKRPARRGQTRQGHAADGQGQKTGAGDQFHDILGGGIRPLIHDRRGHFYGFSAGSKDLQVLFPGWDTTSRHWETTFLGWETVSLNWETTFLYWETTSLNWGMTFLYREMISLNWEMTSQYRETISQKQKTVKKAEKPGFQSKTGGKADGWAGGRVWRVTGQCRLPHPQAAEQREDFTEHVFRLLE